MKQIKVKKRKEGHMAYIEFKGPYDKVPFDKYYERLFRWAKTSGAKKAFAPPFAVYPVDPKSVPESEIVTRVAIAIKNKVPGEGEIKVATLPEMEVAQLWHKAPASEYGASYAELERWVKENGYEINGFPMEAYMGMPKKKGDVVIMNSVIQFPVKKR